MILGTIRALGAISISFLMGGALIMAIGADYFAWAHAIQAMWHGAFG